METERSLSQSMDNAKKHYSSLFSLPSIKRSLISIIAICAVGVSLTTYALYPGINSILLGILLLIIAVATDFLVSKVLLRDDPIFVLRRTSAMSFYCWLIWLAFLSLGTALGYFFGTMIWLKLALIGYAAVLTLRIIVLTATSSVSKAHQMLSAMLQPILSSLAFLVFWISTLPSSNISPMIYLYIILAPIISYAAVTMLLHSIDRLGKATYGLPALNLFKSFILNWVSDANEPLEKQLEALGQDANIEVKLLKFDAVKPKAAIVMPMVHPGPFKNIGSSLLPSMMKHDYEKQYDCSACTPLGILGHELDLASQIQNRKIVKEVIDKANFQSHQSTASPFVRATSGCAIASCQLFGDTAFISFSMAPQTTEDLPQELGHIITDEVKRNGLKHAVLVNAHNALAEDSADMNEHLEELKQAAFGCLQKATTQPTASFKVGAATIYPKNFTQKQGMGTGGITAIVIEVNKQKTAYITIDGNNMIPKLREKILGTLASLGFDESEVFTTDTHAVSALVTGKRGYHPIGEAIDQDLLISYIGEAAKQALMNIEESSAGFLQFVVPQVRVIGEDRLQSISTLVDKAIVKAKKVAPPIFGTEGLIFILLLLLF